MDQYPFSQVQLDEPKLLDRLPNEELDRPPLANTSPINVAAITADKIIQRDFFTITP